MRCHRCRRVTRKPLKFNGKFYGPTCARKAGMKGSARSAQRKYAYFDEHQLDLFGEENEQNEQS